VNHRTEAKGSARIVDIYSAHNVASLHAYTRSN